jgi:hypothetical protein
MRKNFAWRRCPAKSAAVLAFFLFTLTTDEKRICAGRTAFESLISEAQTPYFGFFV